jgi:hypothetical protein
MVVAALALRLAVVAFLYPEILNPDRDHWRFAGEAGRIAQSIVEGRGFSSPFQGATGPTAIMPPIYPSLLAGVFRLFGIYTNCTKKLRRAHRGLGGMDVDFLSLCNLLLRGFHMGHDAGHADAGFALPGRVAS